MMTIAEQLQQHRIRATIRLTRKPMFAVVPQLVVDSEPHYPVWPRCPDCGLRIKSANHVKGEDHKRGINRRARVKV
jgi:hypothetical protein